MLQQLQVVVTTIGDKPQATQHTLSVEQISTTMSEIREVMEQSSETTAVVVEQLKNSSANPGSKYYWLVFVATYGGVYFFQ